MEINVVIRPHAPRPREHFVTVVLSSSHGSRLQRSGPVFLTLLYPQISAAERGYMW